MKKWIVLAVLFFIILGDNELLAQGCSQCKLMAEQGSELEEASFGSSINTGILYLMLIPYLLIMFLFRKYIFKFFRSLVRR
ncbi:MAG: hypothetical protein RI883_2612 [Bacteroidota bacterium]|jgi:hypothetical protein